jgi:hypothetical protein
LKPEPNLFTGVGLPTVRSPKWAFCTLHITEANNYCAAYCGYRVRLATICSTVIIATAILAEHHVMCGKTM